MECAAIHRSFELPAYDGVRYGKRRSVMANDIKAEIARKSAEVLQKIKADSRLSHYVPADRVPSVFMGTDDKRD